MRPLTLCSLIGAAFLALLTLPLLFLFLPVGATCGAASLLLALLAIPDLATSEQPGAETPDPLYG